MAIPVTRHLRPIIAIAALAAAAFAAPTLASATPKPTPASIPAVQKQLGELALQNSQVVEKYDRAQVAVQRREQAAHAAELAAAQANTDYQREHTRFALTVQDQYESNSFGAAGALLDSSSGDNYLDRLNTLSMVSAQTAQIVQSMRLAKDKATKSAAAAEQLLAAAR
ncbi:MAG TPA: hypothetical protein VKB75_17300, partial [Jatrophihabitans sp.]|nr:hypothetical protein [Jatrophihabitans sp.]